MLNLNNEQLQFKSKLCEFGLNISFRKISALIDKNFKIDRGSSGIHLSELKCNHYFKDLGFTWILEISVKPLLAEEWNHKF